MAREKLTIEEMHKIAANRGGKCLSNIYKGTKTYLYWQCKEGHEWKAAPFNIQSGRWCPYCAKVARLTIEDMHVAAANQGGKCLSDIYKGGKTHLQWQCREGHEWEAAPAHIRQGKWCPHCAGVARLTIEDMHAAAAKRNGECLSDIYKGSHTRLRWRCTEGHEWMAMPESIRQGTWCPHCAGHLLLTIDEMHAMARKRGGKCLSTTYINSQTRLHWQCNEGHEWKAVPASVRQGTWCAKCAEIERLTIEDMHSAAAKRGGKCLSDNYINSKTHLRWQCSEGHEWKAAPVHIRQGKWCPYCAGRAPLTIEHMHSFASKRGGKCLSDSYINNRAKLQWRCAQGHEWMATPNIIYKGAWCPYCAGRPPLTIEDMHLTANKRNGKCLSGIYQNNKTPLQWQCAEGHEWLAIPDSIRQGRWCPDCAGRTPLTIEKMRAVAVKKGGKCISDIYVNARTHLQWECAEGHKWEATPDNIQRGTWCPECSDGRGERLTRAILTRMFHTPFPKVRPDWLLSPIGGRLELDGFAESLAVPIAFEYQGTQHYEETWLHNADQVQIQIQRDAIKRRICHERGVRLVAVPEFKSFRNLSGCIDQIEAAVLFAGLKIPRRWKRPTDLNELLNEAPPRPKTNPSVKRQKDAPTLFCFAAN